MLDAAAGADAEAGREMCVMFSMLNALATLIGFFVVTRVRVGVVAGLRNFVSACVPIRARAGLRTERRAGQHMLSLHMEEIMQYFVRAYNNRATQLLYNAVLHSDIHSMFFVRTCVSVFDIQTRSLRFAVT